MAKCFQLCEYVYSAVYLFFLHLMQEALSGVIGNECLGGTSCHFGLLLVSNRSLGGWSSLMEVLKTGEKDEQQNKKRCFIRKFHAILFTHRPRLGRGFSFMFFFHFFLLRREVMASESVYSQSLSLWISPSRINHRQYNSHLVPTMEA